MNQNRESNPSQTETGFINKKQIQFSQNQEWIVFLKIWHSYDFTHKYKDVCVWAKQIQHQKQLVIKHKPNNTVSATYTQKKDLEPDKEFASNQNWGKQ